MLSRWGMGDADAIARDIEAGTTLAPVAEDVIGFQQFLKHNRLVQQARPANGSRSLWKWLLDNYLFIRIPLVRPMRLLRAMQPWTEWIFTRWFALATALAAIVGIALAARQLDAVEANLRGALTWDGITGFAGALIVSKLLHELGHAMVSTRNGVRVGHMGVAMLVMWPMPYTDTGESWKLEKSTSRLAIASAGIATELVLAAWATLLWSFAPEGQFKNALFFLATTAWVLTLAVNASPFMRFDGYFILADFLDFPGLHERAGLWAKRFVRKLAIGIEDPTPEVLPKNFSRFLTVFALLTWVYRLALFLGIALVVYHAFFKALGVALFIVEISVFVFRPILSEMKVWWRRRAEASATKLRIWIAILFVVAVGVLVPWSGSVSAPGVMRAGSEHPVFSPYAARLEKIHLTNGTQVKAGDVIAELSAPGQSLERDKANALAGAYAQAARGSLGVEDSGAARSVLAQRFSDRWQAEIVARNAELARLRLVATQPGELRDVDVTLQPGTWVGTSTPIAWVIDPTHWRVEALVNERERSRLQAGGSAAVYTPGTSEPVRGRIVSIDTQAVTRLPHLLFAQPHGGPVVLNPGTPATQLRPAEALYRVTVEGAEPFNATSVKRVSVHFDATRVSPARQWIDNAVSIFIQQAGF